MIEIQTVWEVKTTFLIKKFRVCRKSRNRWMSKKISPSSKDPNFRIKTNITASAVIFFLPKKNEIYNTFGFSGWKYVRKKDLSLKSILRLASNEFFHSFSFLPTPEGNSSREELKKVRPSFFSCGKTNLNVRQINWCDVNVIAECSI